PCFPCQMQVRVFRPKLTVEPMNRALKELNTALQLEQVLREREGIRAAVFHEGTDPYFKASYDNVDYSQIPAGFSTVVPYATSYRENR
ncbi:hypothetical protein O5290_30480, partial [Escherichia coli]|nr:hypothetical protein [Escherichia coli]